MERAEETGAAASFERKLSDTLTINVERAPKMLPLNLKQGKFPKKKENKMAIYCPKGSGRLRQQLLMMH